MDIGIVWDLDEDEDGNVRHCASHDVTKEEVGEVLDNWLLRNTTVSSSSGYPITFGYTSSGRHLAVVWQKFEEAPLTVRPITAYEVE